MTSLNYLLHQYRTGECTKKSVQDAFVLYIYDHPCVKFRLSSDERHDFVLELIPRIASLIERFELGDRPVEAYLSRMSRFHLRTFGKSKTLSKQRNSAVEEYARYSEGKSQSAQKFTLEILDYRWNPADKIRILYFALLSAPLLSLPQIKALSDFCGVDIHQLFEWIHKLRNLNEVREKRRLSIKEKIDNSYAQYIVTQYRCSQSDTGDTTRLADRMHAGKNNLYRHRKELLEYNSSCTHRSIAYVLGVSKGTIDSSIYHIKRKLKMISQNRYLEEERERA